MVQHRIRLALALLGAMASVAMAQQLQVVSQTPRQAVIELLTGEESAARKHLTLEVQKQIAASGNSAASLGGMSLLGMMNMAKASGGPEFQIFESGPILFVVDNQ